MILRLAGGALIAAAAIASAVTPLFELREPSLELALVDALPAVTQTRDGGNRLRALGLETVGAASYVPDPLLRRYTSFVQQEQAYETSLEKLLAAQVELRIQQERMFAAADALAAAERDVDASSRSAEILSGRRASVAAASLRVRDAAEAVRDESTRVASARQNRDENMEPAGRGVAYRGTLVERNVIVLTFGPSMRARSVDSFLASQRLSVRGAIPRLGVLIVNIGVAEWEETYEEEATRLRATIDRLNALPMVRSAVQNTLLSGHRLPRKNTPYPNDQPRDWFATPPDALTAAGFPKVWNLNDALATKTIEVGVLDEGFLPTPTLCSTPPCDLDVKELATCPGDPRSHGTMTAGVIGAIFDNLIGSDGAVPGVKLAGCGPELPAVIGTSNLSPAEAAVATFDKDFARYLDGLDLLLAHLAASGVGVINVSLGYNWGDLPATNPHARALAQRQGTTVHSAMTLSANAKTILVASAGNDLRQPAEFASPFNWAGLGLPAAKRANNVIVVMALQRNGVDPLPGSNVGGDIAAIGVRVLTVADLDLIAYHGGTSAAAPLVASAVAIMRALRPALTVTEIRTNLGLGTGQPLNAYAAILKDTTDLEDELSDLKPGDGLDDQDFEVFRLDFRDHETAMRANPPRFRRDLNRDGNIDPNDQFFCRIDLDGNGKVERADLEVMIRARKLNAADAEALRRRL